MTTTNCRYVIVGLGDTGLSCARYLDRQGLPIAITDTRLAPPQLTSFQKEFPHVPVGLGALNRAMLDQAAAIVLSPGIALHDPVIAEYQRRGVPIIGDIELFAQAVKAPVIGITGTNAKSTVTTLVGLMAKAAGYHTAVGGNLGVPALALLTAQPQADLFVLELSSFQLETTFSLKSAVSTILNITPDHMDRYASVADYQRAKQRIYQHCQIAVCNRDDPLTLPYSDKQTKRFFTLAEPKPEEFGLKTIQGDTQLCLGDQPLLPVSALPVMGKHYQANALSALAIGHAFGLPMATMLAVLEDFRGLPHRCQLVRERAMVRWYNDSKGTNVGATQAAIEGLGSEIHGKLVLIAGGVGKNADFSPLVPAIQRYCRHVVLIGEAAEDLARVLHGVVDMSFANNMETAVAAAAEAAQPNDSVLLSPACASFDMFRHYAHRGDAFTASVLALV